MLRKDAPENICVWDTETDGVDIDNCHILTAYAMVQSIDGKVITEKHWTIDPGVEIPEAASAVHGMSTEWIREHGNKDAKGQILDIADFLEAHAAYMPIVGYNNSFDLGILDRELMRHCGGNSALLDIGWDVAYFDPIIYDRATDKYRKGGRKLIDVARHYGLEIDESRLHEAEYDVILTAKLAWKLLQKSPYTLAELQGLQYTWKREWAKGLTKYFAQAGKTEEDGSPIVVDGSFPWRKREDNGTEG